MRCRASVRHTFDGFRKMKLIGVIICLMCASGCTSPINKATSVEDRALWNKHCEAAHGAAYRWLSRSHYGTQPWFVEGESLVYADRELIALRYHAAFIFGRKDHQRLKEYETARQATHVVEYDLKTKQWSLVGSEHKNWRKNIQQEN